MHPEVLKVLGHYGCSEGATNLLATGDLGNLPQFINDPSLAYLRECRWPYEIKRQGVFSMDFSTMNHQQSWQKMDEYTSSSFSGDHFGTYIARSNDSELAAMDAALARIPAISGYSPNRWQKGLNVMMEKKPGENRVDKMRTILLYEADYNHDNKHMARSFMRNAEKYNLIAPEHYGSRKYHNAQDQALNKVLLFDILRQTRQRAALNSVDLQSCYDRIQHTASPPFGLLRNWNIMCSRYMETPPNPFCQEVMTNPTKGRVKEMERVLEFGQ